MSTTYLKGKQIIRGENAELRLTEESFDKVDAGERRGDKTHRDYRLRPPPRLYPNPPTKGGG